MELDVTVNHDTVFLQTSLDTHLVMMVYRGETVANFKKRISHEHRVSFPRLGDIEVEALKVKSRGQLFTLSDFAFVKSVFLGNRGFLYVDASSPGKVFSNIKVVSTDEKEKLILPIKDKEGEETKIGDQEVDRKNDVSTKSATKKGKSRKTVELVVSDDPSLKENDASPYHNAASCYEGVALEKNLCDKSTVTRDHSTGGLKAVIGDHSSFNAEKEERYVSPMGMLKVSNANSVITSNFSTEIDTDDAVLGAKASKSEACTETTDEKSKTKRKRKPESYPQNQEVQTNNNNSGCEGEADRKIANVLLNLESQFNGSNLEGERDGVVHKATSQNGTSDVHSVSTKDQGEILTSGEAIVHKKPNAIGATEFNAKGTKDKVETQSSVSRTTDMDTDYVSLLSVGRMPDEVCTENRDEKSRKKRRKKQEPYPQNVEDDQNTNNVILSNATVSKSAATLSNLENNDVGNVSTQDQHATVASSEVVVHKMPMAKAANELNAKDSKNKGQMQSLVSETTDMDTEDAALSMVKHMPKVSKNEVNTGEKSRKRKRKKKEESCPQNLEVQTVSDNTVHEGADTMKAAKDLLNIKSQLIGLNDLKAKKTNNKVDKQSFSPPCSGSSLEPHGKQLKTRACNSGSTHRESSLKSESDKVPLQKKRKSQDTPVLNNPRVLQPVKRDERNSVLEKAKRPADSDASKTNNKAVKKGPALVAVLKSSSTPSSGDGKGNSSVGYHRETGKTVSANIQTVNSSEQKKSLLGTTGSIFKDDTDESSEDENSDNDSDDVVTRTPLHSPLLPDLSDGGSDDDKKNAQPTGQKKSDGETNKSESPSQKNICLDEILKRSITYKKAKVAASRSLLEDSESLQVEFVPDSQAM